MKHYRLEEYNSGVLGKECSPRFFCDLIWTVHCRNGLAPTSKIHFVASFKNGFFQPQAPSPNIVIVPEIFTRSLSEIGSRSLFSDCRICVSMRCVAPFFAMRQPDY